MQQLFEPYTDQVATLFFAILVHRFLHKGHICSPARRWPMVLMWASSFSIFVLHNKQEYSIVTSFSSDLHGLSYIGTVDPQYTLMVHGNWMQQPAEGLHGSIICHMKVFDIDGILTNLHEILNLPWKTVALNHKLNVTQQPPWKQWVDGENQSMWSFHMHLELYGDDEATTDWHDLLFDDVDRDNPTNIPSQNKSPIWFPILSHTPDLLWRKRRSCLTSSDLRRLHTPGSVDHILSARWPRIMWREGANIGNKPCTVHISFIQKRDVVYLIVGAPYDPIGNVTFLQVWQA